MATSGDHYLATSGEFFMATDTALTRTMARSPGSANGFQIAQLLGLLGSLRAHAREHSPNVLRRGTHGRRRLPPMGELPGPAYASFDGNT